MMAQALKTRFGHFLRWWGRELRGCLPAGVADRLFGSRDTLEISIGAGQIGFALRSDGAVRVLGTVPVARLDEAGQGADLADLLDKVPPAGNVTLRLPHELAPDTVVELPVEAADNLEEALRLELDTLTPFPASEALFDFTVLGSDDDLKRLRLGLLVARKRDVEEALDRVRRIGVEPDRVTGPASDIPGARGFNLLPRDARPRAGHLVPRVTAGLFILALGLLAATQVFWFARTNAEIDRVERLAAQLRAEAGAAGDLRDRVEHLAEVSRRLSERKTEVPTTLAVLDAFSGVLPQSDWLSAWTIEDGAMRASGYSANPAATLRQVEASGMFTEARFTAPLTMDEKLGRERFSIEARIAAEGGQP